MSKQECGNPAPVLWFKALNGLSAKPNGQCYDVAFCEVPGYEPLYRHAAPLLPSPSVSLEAAQYLAEAAQTLEGIEYRRLERNQQLGLGKSALEDCIARHDFLDPGQLNKAAVPTARTARALQEAREIRRHYDSMDGCLESKRLNEQTIAAPLPPTVGGEVVVQRYDFCDQGDRYPDPLGSWVDYDDHRAHVTALSAQLAASQEALANHDTASKAMDAWVAERGQMPWATAIKMLAILTKMPDAERDRLLNLDDGSTERGALIEQLAASQARVAELEELLRNLDEAWNDHSGRTAFGILMQSVEKLAQQVTK